MVGAMSTRLVGCAAVPVSAAVIYHQERPRLVRPPATMLAAADRHRLARLGSDPAPAGNAVGLASSRRAMLTAATTPPRPRSRVRPGFRRRRRRRPTARCASPRGRPAAPRGRARSRRAAPPCPAPPPRCRRSPAARHRPCAGQPVLELDAIADRLLAVIGADQQQDLLALGAQPLDGAHDLGDAALGAGAAPRHAPASRAARHAACGRDRRATGMPRPAGALQHFGAEALGHRPVAGRIVADSAARSSGRRPAHRSRRGDRRGRNARDRGR